MIIWSIPIENNLFDRLHVLDVLLALQITFEVKMLQSQTVQQSMIAIIIMADLLGSILGSMEKPPSADETERKRRRGEWDTIPDNDFASTGSLKKSFE